MMTAPWKREIASKRESFAFWSRWFVGSSKTRKLLFLRVIKANLAFVTSPPESSDIFLIASSFRTPTLAKQERILVLSSSGWALWMNSKGVKDKSIFSSWE